MVGFKNLSADDKRTIIEHLEELRKLLIICVTVIVIASIASFAYSEQILWIIAAPLTALQQKLIVTGVTEAFFVKLQLSFLAGFIIAFPIVAGAVWHFIKPALYPQERKYIYILLPVTLALFAGGVSFAYFSVLRFALNFFVYIAGSNIQPLFKIDQYVSFVMSITLPFGLVFELPVAVFFLTKIGIVNYKWLARNRKYAILIIVVIAAMLTPTPDPFTQIMMATPMYILYEVSILVSRISGKGRTWRGKAAGTDK